MADATDQQVKDLEAAMTDQFYMLATAAALRIAIARKYGLTDPAFIDYNAKYVPLVKSWILREVPYEQENLKQGIKGIIASGELVFDDFFLSASLPKLVALTKKFNVDGTTSGIGFIPLLIWAVIAIVGFFSAARITDDLTSTTKDKEALMKTTAETAAKLNLTPAQAQSLITTTQAEATAASTAASGGIADTLKWGALALGAVFILPKILDATSKSHKQ